MNVEIRRNKIFAEGKEVDLNKVEEVTDKENETPETQKKFRSPEERQKDIRKIKTGLTEQSTNNKKHKRLNSTGRMAEHNRQNSNDPPVTGITN